MSNAFRSAFQPAFRRAFSPAFGLPYVADLRIAVIQALFGNGEQGALYDPSDLSTLYQDSAGTTPVTADGDPVGLMLDLSQGLELGAEQVSNGGFDTDTAWTKGSNWTISGGTASHSGSGDYLLQDFGASVGAWYEVTLDVIGADGSNFVQIYLGDSPSLASITSPGTHTIKGVMKSGALHDISIRGVGSVSVDNVSVRELPGNHATQSTTSAKPLYRTDGTLHWLEFDGFDDELRPSALGITGGTNRTCMFSALVNANGNPAFSMGPYVTGKRWTLISNNNKLRVEITGSGQDSTFDMVGETGVYGAILNGTTFGDHELHKNLTSESTSGASSVDTEDNDRYIGSTSVAPNLDGKLYAHTIVGKAVGGSDLRKLKDWLASKGGVTL